VRSRIGTADDLVEPCSPDESAEVDPDSKSATTPGQSRVGREERPAGWDGNRGSAATPGERAQRVRGLKPSFTAGSSPEAIRRRMVGAEQCSCSAASLTVKQRLARSGARM
jgi:hypothetical protein